MIGAGPLPGENRGRVNAGGLRTRQFLEVVLGRHDVSLIVVENEEYHDTKIIKKETWWRNSVEKKKEEKDSKRHFRHVAVSKCLSNITSVIQKEVKSFSPDIVIGVNTFPSFLAAQVVPKDIPFWADLNGWVMAEIQAQAASQKTNAFLPHGFRRERKILHRADKVSVVSRAQKFACIGELSCFGRLSKDNFRHPFVEVIENACLAPLPHLKRQEGSAYRGKTFPQNAVAALWLGGFNAWADEETLFCGLEEVMAQNPHFHFVFTGDILPGIEEEKYPRFCSWVKSSKYASRYHLLGWIDSEKVPALMQECDIGVNTDLLCAETETGARNRINEMLRYKMPIVSTRGSEIAKALEEYSAGITCASGDPKEFTHALLELVDNPKKRESIKNEGEVLIKKRFSATITGRPLKKWLENPYRAPDKGKAVSLESSLGYISSAIEYGKKRGIKILIQKCTQRLRSRFGK